MGISSRFSTFVALASIALTAMPAFAQDPVLDYKRLREVRKLYKKITVDIFGLKEPVEILKVKSDAKSGRLALLLKDS